MAESLRVRGGGGREGAAMITPERMGDTEKEMRETEDGASVKASFHSVLFCKRRL